MKKLLFILAFASFGLSMAQAPEGMVKVDQVELEKHATELANLAALYPGLRTVPAVLHLNADPQFNHPSLEKLWEEFKDAAKFYQVDYQKKLNKVRQVVYIDADPFFLGSVSKDGTSIFLNAKLVDYENLRWIVFNHQQGKLFGLKEEKQGHQIMSVHWAIDDKHEDIAEKRRSRPHEKKAFFEALHVKNGLDTEI